MTMTKNEKAVWIATYAANVAHYPPINVIGSLEASFAAKRASEAVTALRRVRCHADLQREIDEILFGEET